MMMPGRLSNKVMLPLGPQWGNGGGVAACMNWYSNVAPKPPQAPPKDTNTHRQGPTRRVHIKGEYDATHYNTGRLESEKYIHTPPWAEEVGLTRVDGKLKLTHARKNPDHGYVGNSYPDDAFYADTGRTDTVLPFDDYGRQEDMLRTSRLTYRPPTPSRKYHSTQAHTRAIAEAHQSLSRTAPVRPATPKRYGIMGPPPPREATTSQNNFSRISRPANPSPSNEEVYKYTEREFIIEDIDDDKSAVRERAELYTSRPKNNYRNTGLPSNKNTRAVSHYDLNGRPHTAGDRNQFRESNKYLNTTAPRFVNSVDGVETFSATPIPMPAVWQTSEFDWPVKSKAMTSRPKTAGPRDFTFKLEPTPPGGGRKANGYSTKFPESSSKAADAADNVLIHVDCSKLTNAARPTTVTVRLHGVDTSAKVKDANVTPFGTR